MDEPVDLDAYFERIAFHGTATPTLQTLRELHALHTQAIPFDGFSPFLGEKVKLDVDSLQEKLVRGGRGGYCFEQNVLLWRVLETIGFRVTGLSGRVWKTPYLFQLRESFMADYEMFNWYFSAHPQAPFVSGVILACPEPGRRHALRNTRYSVHQVNGTAGGIQIAVAELAYLRRETRAFVVPQRQIRAATTRGRWVISDLRRQGMPYAAKPGIWTKKQYCTTWCRSSWLRARSTSGCTKSSIARRGAPVASMS
jgi:arylamine N-acetyltransferase